MYYSVLITEEYIEGVDEDFYNELIFIFYQLEEAEKFAFNILKHSPYSVKIIQEKEKHNE